MCLEHLDPTPPDTTAPTLTITHSPEDRGYRIPASGNVTFTI